jgi:hypothetical protein
MIKSRRMEWTGHVTRMCKRRGAYRVLVGKREGKIPLGIPSIRWEDNIKMHQELEWGMDCIDLTQDRDRLRGFVMR